MNKETLRPKKVSESAIEYYPVEIFPHHLNPHKTVFGGFVLSTADALAGTVAQRHSNQTCVTLFLDAVRFVASAKDGDRLVYKVAVNRAWNTSMEIGVKVMSEKIYSDGQNHIASMYFTYVAIDRDQHPQGVPQVVPESEYEKRRYTEAGKRRKQRFKLYPPSKKN